MKKKILYEVSMSILAVTAVILALLDLTKGLLSWQIIIDNIILIIFVFDYFIRLFLSSDKKSFIKDNVLDLIAIIPFNSVFRAFRIFKLGKLVRLMKLTKLTKLTRFFAYLFRFLDKIKSFIDTNGFKYMLLITAFFIGVGGVLIHYAEGMSISDGLWWAFVTATTVGYGDISPASPTGRLVAMALMLVGIGLIGSLTSTITSFFFNARSRKRNFESETIENIKIRLDDIKSLSDEEIDTICSILKTLNK
nr:potassium channel family protein [uncultured Blautia sp.]